MATIIYPSLQQPILTAAQTPETVTEDRWHQPWSDPSGRLNAKVAAGVAVALIASGLSFAPQPIANTTQTIDQLGYAWSEPVRTAPQLATAGQAFHGFVEAAPFEEQSSPDKWFAPLSEPVRVPARLVTAAQQAFATDPVSLTQPESVGIDKFLLPLSEPVRVPARLVTAAQQAFATDPRRLLDRETVTEDRWHQPWSEPQRDLAGQRVRLALRVASQQVEPPNPFWVTQPESVRIDKFLLPLSEPVRLPRALAVHHQQFLTLDTKLALESVRIDKFLLNWSEPVRLKPGLRPELQQAFTISPFALGLKRPFAKCYVIT